MDKPASLRRAIEKQLPYYVDHPAELAMEIRGGAVIPVANTLSFEQAYQLTVTFYDCVTPKEDICLIILRWLQEHETAMPRNPDRAKTGFTFDIDILDAQKSDIDITLAISEHIVYDAKTGEYAKQSQPDYGKGLAPRTLEQVIGLEG